MSRIVILRGTTLAESVLARMVLLLDGAQRRRTAPSDEPAGRADD